MKKLKKEIIMSSLIKKIRKTILGLSFLVLHPRRVIINLYEDYLIYQINSTSSNNYLKKISLEQLNDLSDGVLPEIRFLSFLGGGSGPTDYLLLLILSKQYKYFDYLEIGTWRGESIRNILEMKTCKKAVSITLDPNEFVESNSSIYETSNVFLDFNDKRLKQIFADSKKYDFSGLGKFDLIFIDGDHSYEGIHQDTKNALKLLKDDNSVIVWHDYSYDNDQNVRFSTLKAIKDAIPIEEHKYLYYVENTMSAVYIKRVFKFSEPNEKNHFSKPKSYFSAILSINPIDNRNF